MKDVQDILQNLSKDLLSENQLKELSEAFEQEVQKRIDINVEQALAAQDEDYANKMTALIEKIDQNHTSKLEGVVKLIEKNYTQKLHNAVSKYEKIYNNKFKKLTEWMLRTTDAYLDKYLDDAIPKSTVKKLAENVRARQIIDNLRNDIILDKATENKLVRKAILEGHSKMKRLEEENKVLKTSRMVEFNKKKEETRQEELNKLLEGVRPVYRAQVKRALENKTLSYIRENFDYVVDSVKAARTRLTEEANEKKTPIFESTRQRNNNSRFDRQRLIEKYKRSTSNRYDDDLTDEELLNENLNPDYLEGLKQLG